jgi:hypothetical protein
MFDFVQAVELARQSIPMSRGVGKMKSKLKINGMQVKIVRDGEDGGVNTLDVSGVWGLDPVHFESAKVSDIPPAKKFVWVDDNRFAHQMIRVESESGIQALDVQDGKIHTFMPELLVNRYRSEK